MKELIFVTGNADKFVLAQKTIEAVGVKLVQETHDVDEIQGEDGDAIALDKALRAYEIIKRPLVVNDDTWEIHGLNGFPGPYMKSMNQWFSPDDFLRLTKDLKDRTVSLIQRTVYKDETRELMFTKTINATLLTEARGTNGPPFLRVITFTGDKRSASESYETDWTELNLPNVWDDVATWLKENKS